MLAPVLIAVMLLTPAAAFSAPAVSCHCFRDREFDRARPASADPYILATAQSSLLSAAFGIEKTKVVRARMAGTSADDLWVAHWSSARTGLEAEQFLASRSDEGSWRAAFSALKIDVSRLGQPFARELAAGATDAALGAEAADDVLRTRLCASPDDVRSVRAEGASTPEAVIACLLAPKARETPSAVISEVRSGQKTWGGLLKGVGMEPRDIEPEIRRKLR